MQNELRIIKNEKTSLDLSSRELEVLRYIAFGYTSKEIANQIHLSTHTVQNHRKRMLLKSKCGTVAELVRIAMLEHRL
jgi:DNA-binding CsgD family transcriptional regulator